MEQPKPQRDEFYRRAVYCISIDMMEHFTELLQVKQSKFNQKKLDEHTQKLTKLLKE